MAASIGLSASVVLGFGTSLIISNNRFVAPPMLVAALCYFVPGGLAAGALGLPANLLLKELNHRGKNNLSVIKSGAHLQRNRSRDPDFLMSIDRLVERIHAIALVYEQLNRPEGCRASVDPEHSIDGDYRLIVRDTGPGFDPEAPDSNAGLGLRMMRALAHQLDGRVVFGKTSLHDCVEGAHIELRWPSGGIVT